MAEILEGENVAHAKAAGADEVLDLAIALSTGVAYLRAMTDHGLSVAAALAEIEFSLAAGVDLFITVAKLRAARRLWARVAEAIDEPIQPGRKSCGLDG